jgi:hypothetical protein
MEDGRSRKKPAHLSENRLASLTQRDTARRSVKSLLPSASFTRTVSTVSQKSRRGRRSWRFVCSANCHNKSQGPEDTPVPVPRALECWRVSARLERERRRACVVGRVPEALGITESRRRARICILAVFSERRRTISVGSLSAGAIKVKRGQQQASNMES